MDSLLLTDQDRLQLAALTQNPPHALLLVGPAGFGKRHVAVTWALQLTPHVEVMQPDEKGIISIDTVRTLYQQTRSKRAHHQAVVVDHAEVMGIEAQNAYLKLLEEPRPGVTFILTTSNLEALLPTITSRVQTVAMHTVAPRVLQAWVQAQKKLAPQDLAQLLFVAQGRPGIAATLLRDDQAFAHHRALMQHAKQLLSASPYERLAALNDLAKNKPDMIATLEAMSRMVHMQLSKGNDGWLPLADALQACLSALAQNGNPRAQLTHLFTT